MLAMLRITGLLIVEHRPRMRDEAAGGLGLGPKISRDLLCGRRIDRAGRPVGPS
jgi:hypothetical protein